MLATYDDLGIETKIADARNLPYGNNAFDHLVFPLILHHITGRHGWAARRQAAVALGEAYRVLVPDGRVWISEYQVSPLVYGFELLASPITAWLLSLLRIPLVVMHSRSYYRKTLARMGFDEIEFRFIRSPEARTTDLVQPVIGLPWLKIPRFAYPVRHVLITARRA